MASGEAGAAPWAAATPASGSQPEDPPQEPPGQPRPFEALLPHLVQSVGEARRMLRDDLRRRGVPGDVVDDAMVVLSELVANSLRHATPTGEGGVRVAWELTPEVVVLRVTDGGGPARPAEAPASTTGTSGRGLAIVRELSSSWGFSEEQDAVTVHAVLPLEP